MTKFEQMDTYQWVKTLNSNVYEIINGIELPDGRINFGYYTVNFNDYDPEDIDKLDDLITTYYSSCTDFFLNCSGSKDQQKELIAEMIAEQEWNELQPTKTFTINENDIIENNDPLKLVLANLQPTD